MESEGSKRCIGFIFSSTVLQNSDLIDLHHSASVWDYELCVFVVRSNTLYVSQ